MSIDFRGITGLLPHYSTVLLTTVPLLYVLSCTGSIQSFIVSSFPTGIYLSLFHYLCRCVIHKVVFLHFYKFPECLAPPGMIHRRQVAFLRSHFLIISIKFPGFLSLFRDFFQCIYILIIYAAIEASVKCTDYHSLCAFAVMYLIPAGI